MGTADLPAAPFRPNTGLLLRPPSLEAPLPRVLVLGPNFSSRTGEGITVSSLFKGWPPERLAVATIVRDLAAESQVTRNYYQFGPEELYWSFPFSLLQGKGYPFSGKIPEKYFEDPAVNPSVAGIAPREGRPWKKMLRLGLSKVLSAMGLYHSLYRHEPSDRFLAWVQSFKPDLVYTHATNIENMEFILKTLAHVPAALVVHVMDDYLSVQNQMNLTHGYWKKHMDRSFRKLLERADLALSISEAMSEEYEQRFGKAFVPFHHPVDLDRWKPQVRNQWAVKGTFQVLYAGRVGRGTYRSLLEVAQAVSALGEKGMDIRFSLHTHTQDAPIVDTIASLPHCVVCPPFPHAEACRYLSAADLLVMPMDFEQENFRYIRLSMPTKFSEYMASGTPVLVYSPEGSALAGYAARHGCALVVSSRRPGALESTLKEVASDAGLRERLGKKGAEIAFSRHNGQTVRARFQDLMRTVVRARNTIQIV